jgi:DNA-binding response OmpR family regulator
MPFVIDTPSSDVRCPVCRQAWPGVKRPRVSLDDNLFIAERGTVALTSTEAEIMWCLTCRMPHAVAHDTIVSAVYGIAEPSKPLLTIRAEISALRHKIEPLGYAIEAIWGRGYRLMPVGEPS